MNEESLCQALLDLQSTNVLQDNEVDNNDETDDMKNIPTVVGDR